MHRTRPLPLALLLSTAATAQQPVPTLTPAPGLVITRSVRLQPGHYRLAATDTVPLLTIRGDSLTVDFTGVTLEGNSDHGRPDRFGGLAILIDHGTAVTVRGGTVRGYKIAVLARGTRDLRLTGLDVSHNWKPRLHSVVEYESLADWLSYHHNESDEWLRYGAGIYLDGVRGGEVRESRAVQGMNGLLLSRSSGIRIWNNDFSWLSGLGIGLYRSSDNVIMHNRVAWCVRGYSDGFYARGQDSAALLMFEQSSNNIVALNDMTHGGDGLFLWAGQTTMDTGHGGSNDNLFFGNDFSFAPTNGMEATFSRNRFLANRVEGSTHGLWGGYSYASEILGNRFSHNRVGIAIEHGQDNAISGNRFVGDTTAIRLWWNRLEPSDWGYPRYRDTRSHAYTITGNAFNGTPTALRLDSTTDVRLESNRFLSVDTLVAGDGEQTTGDSAGHGGIDRRIAARVAEVRRGLPRLAGARDVVRRADRRGRSAIIVDEWGPYDWQSPKLWPVGRRDGRPARLRVLGPPGRWRIVAEAGIASASRREGRTGDTLTVTPAAGRERDWSLTLEYRGARTVSPSGDTTAAGQSVRFGYRRFVADFDWRVRVVTWDSTTDPRTDSLAFRSRLAGPARLDLRPGGLDWVWYRPLISGIPVERWAAEATGAVELPAGRWLLRTISDDGIRVWLDGALVIDHWTAHESAVDEVPVAPGRHALRVEYYQADGWTEWQVRIVPDE